ncbi:MAG: hypothetical protein IKY08_02190 [Firmicutes bacterium]|nr:hypothetical protein [Bacillota bacterium]
MASNNPVQYDGWWVELNVYFRTTDVRIYDPEQVQIDNMRKVLQYFLAKGWTRNSICGMLGNMMVESTVNPWLFQHSSLDWSDPAAILADSGGMGLTQWTPCRKYYQWAIDSNLDPESGNTMCDRIYYEYQNNLQWSLDNYGQHTWEDFVTSTETPEILARVFLWAYERPADPDLAQRQANARWCFDNLRATIDPVKLFMFLNINKRKVWKRRWKKV